MTGKLTGKLKYFTNFMYINCVKQNWAFARIGYRHKFQSKFISLRITQGIWTACFNKENHFHYFYFWSNCIYLSVLSFLKYSHYCTFTFFHKSIKEGNLSILIIQIVVTLNFTLYIFEILFVWRKCYHMFTDMAKHHNVLM